MFTRRESVAVAKARLDSWKAIAEYLKRSPRTVQRWHADYGLPVHHFGGGKGPVFCYADELDQWLSGFSDGTGAASGAAAHSSPDTRQRSAELTAEADELWEIRSEENLASIAGLYRSAVDLNPANGAAFVGMANALTFSAVAGAMRGSAAYPRAAECLQRALRAGHDGPETRCAAGWLQMVSERRWRRSRESFEGALEQQPTLCHALTGRGLLYVASGSLDFAERYLREAWKKNPLASPLAALLAWVQYLTGDFEQALDTLEQARSSGETGALAASVESLALMRARNTAAAKQVEGIARRYPRSPVVWGAFGYLLAVVDQGEQARQLQFRLDRMQGDIHYASALIAVGLDERHRAVTSLEASCAEGSLWSLGIRTDPALHSLREDRTHMSRLQRLWPDPLNVQERRTEE